MAHDITAAGESAFGIVHFDEQQTDLLPRALRESQRGTVDITVERATSAKLSDIGLDWLDLLERADAPNVFMNPALIRVAGQCYPGNPCRVLLAWQDFGDRPRLVGIWALTIGRAPRSIIPLAVLTAPPLVHAYLATPVIDRSLLDETLDAMLECIAKDRTFPKILALDPMGSDDCTMQALVRVLGARGSPPCILGQSVRPKLASELDGKQYMEKALSASTRKKLRQHRRRLAEKGVLEFRIVTEPEAVRRALDDFLQIEASGWKGRQGTALLSNEADAAFARTMINALVPHGDASIHALYFDGRPVSLQIVLRAGRAAFTWKTAYHEGFHDVSPGMLLLEDYTAAFLADDSIAFVDSCAYDDSGFMAAWSERQTVAHLWIDARRGGSVVFTILTRIQRGYLTFRAAAKRAYVAIIEKRARWRRRLAPGGG